MSLPDNPDSKKEDLIETTGMLVADLQWLERVVLDNAPLNDADLVMWKRDFQADIVRVLGFVDKWQREVN